MRINKILFTYCLFLCAWLPALAQVKFSTVVDEKEIGKNDFVQVQYIVENAQSVENLIPPAFKGFTIASGPMQQNGMSVVNGTMSKYEGLTFVLKPKSTGKFTIAGATVIADGKKMYSNNVTITVTNASATAPPNANSFFGFPMPDMETRPEVSEEYLLKKGEKATDKIKNNLLVKLHVNKNSCYVGEPIVATYKLYSRLKSESKVSKRPSLSQFSVYDMVQPEADNGAVEKVNGKLFNVHTIRKVQLYALQEGKFELDPVEIDNNVTFIRTEESNNSKKNSQDLLDDYMNNGGQGKIEEQHVLLTSKTETITVKPLPALNKPAFFDGAVGKFIISAYLPDSFITANETAFLDVLLSGEGNIPLINAPQIIWPQGIEGDEPTVKENADKTVMPITGNKLFRYPFTVKQMGKQILPAIEFSYFDPATNTYKTIKTSPLPINVFAGAAKVNDATTTTEKEKSTTFLDWKKFLWLLLPVAIAGFAFFRYKKKNKAEKNASVSLPEKRVVAEQIIIDTDPLEAAKAALAINSPVFYKEVSKATWNTLAEKLNITASQLTKPIVTNMLQQRGFSVTNTHVVESVLHDCEMALYTPVHSENDMRLTLEKAERIIKEITALI